MTTPTPRFLQLHDERHEDVRAELAAGLLAPRPRIAPKFLYDALGSRLFDAITELPEYYPTRTERTIFDANAGEMARLLGHGRMLVDLGAGNGEKAVRLFPAFEPAQYVAVDISVDFLRESLERLQREHPGVRMTGIGMDFSRSLRLPEDLGPGPRTLFYPGSSIGNFTPDAARDFLSQCRREAQGGGLLIGVDLVKDKATLESAYDDPLQVTAAFNRNLLRRMAGLLGCDARLEDFAHVALFDEAHSRIEMHLQALRDLTLRWPGGERALHRGERIHTENSYKYTTDGFEALLREAGFSRCRHWTDERRWFAVFAAQ